MSGVQRYGDLEINQDPELQDKVWAWQRVAWLVIAATLASALLGLFGGGPFGRASVRDPGHLLNVCYDRFSRRQAQTSLEVYFRPDPRGVSRVWLSREYVEGAGVRQVTPTPEREIADSAGTTYVLAAAPGDRPVRVMFRLNPERIGLLRPRVQVGNGPGLGFTQFVYP
jgi:protein-L-isoaspartate(D-aspartate) O-methyltransferase